jgi:hypothetical protein
MCESNDFTAEERRTRFSCECRFVCEGALAGSTLTVDNCSFRSPSAPPNRITTQKPTLRLHPILVRIVTSHTLFVHADPCHRNWVIFPGNDDIGKNGCPVGGIERSFTLNQSLLSDCRREPAFPSWAARFTDESVRRRRSRKKTAFKTPLPPSL